MIKDYRCEVFTGYEVININVKKENSWIINGFEKQSLSLKKIGCTSTKYSSFCIRFALSL